MKMNKRRIGTVASIAVFAAYTMAVFPFAPAWVKAQSSTSNTSTTTPATIAVAVATTRTVPAKVLNVDPDGSVLIRGALTSVSTTTMMIESWGGPWTINVPILGVEIYPASVNGNITQFKVGDFIGVLGTVSTSENFVIDANVVRDWTYQFESPSQATVPAASVIPTAPAIPTGTATTSVASTGNIGTLSVPQKYFGTVSDLRSGSFILLTGDRSYTVTVSPIALVVNSGWSTISLASLRNGDTVEVSAIPTSAVGLTGLIIRNTATAPNPISTSATSTATTSTSTLPAVDTSTATSTAGTIATTTATTTNTTTATSTLATTTAATSTAATSTNAY